MARIPRIVIPGAAHHVTQRGNYGRDVFQTDDDRRMYLGCLRSSARLEGLDITAYCLMSNHVHLVVLPQRTDSLGRGLGRTNLMYAQYVHKQQGLLGHFWQARYYSCPMDHAHELNASAYVELNPVRAGMVEKPWEYEWSSAAVHCGKGGDSSGVLNMDRWFEGMSPDRWMGTLEAIASSDDVSDRLRVHTKSGRPIGNQAFLREAEAIVEKPLGEVRRGRPKGSRDLKKRQGRGKKED